MPSRDVSQLILEVDARIATAQRAVNQLAKSVQQDSASMEQSLGKVATSHAQLGKALNDNGRLRAGFTQLSFQIGDVTQQMSLGVSGARIFAQQSGQVIQALQVMGGEGNKFLQFLGGPWGIAISTAAVILAPLASKLFETGDETGKLVDKMREQARQAAANRQADALWKDTIEGLTEAIRKRREEQEKSLQTDIQAEQDSLAQTKKELADARKDVADLIKKQRQAERELADAKSSPFLNSPNPGEASGALKAIELAERKVEDLKRQVNTAQLAVFTAQTNVAGAEAPIAERAVTNRLDKAKAATDAYTVALGNLRKQLQAGSIDQAKFGAELEKAAKKRDAEIEKANAAKKKTAERGSGELTNFIMPVEGPVSSGFGARTPPTAGASSFHPAIDIAAPLGSRVKAAAGGVVIYTGKMGGLGNVVVVDHGGGTITEYGHLSKILTQRGASVGQGDVIAEVGSTGISTGPHLDYRVKVNGKYVDPRKGRFSTDSVAAGMKAGNAAESAADKAIRQQNSFAEQAARLDQELLRAKNDLVQGIDGQADAAVAELVAAQDARKLGIQNDVAEGKLSQAQADILKAKVDQVAFEKIKAVEIQRQLQHLREQDEIEQRTFQYRADDLRFADDMATTQAEHRALQLQILDVVYEQKEAHLEYLRNTYLAAGKMKEAADIQEQLNRLPTEKAHDEERTRKGTMSPLEAWAHDVPKTAADINEALQSIEARGLDNLSSAITDVVMGTKSLGAAFKDIARSIIADIIQMTVKMLIFKAISSAFGLGGGGGDIVMGGGTANFFAANPFGGGRAAGGAVAAGTTYLVGEKGPELFVPGTSGTIVPNAPRIGKLAAVNNNMGGPVEVIIGFGPAPEFAPYVQKVAAAAAGQAVQVSVKHTDQIVRQSQRPKLMGR